MCYCQRLERLARLLLLAMYVLTELIPLLVACVGAYVLYEIGDWTTSRKTKRMPPGPMGLPWIGNRNQVPVIKPWRKFKEWNEQYGRCISQHVAH